MRKFIVLVVVAMLVAACGNTAEEVAERAIESGADGDADVQVDLDDDGGGEIVVETEDGTQTVDLGAGAEIPDAIDVEIPDGYELVGSTTSELPDGVFATIILSYEGGDYDALVAHFDSIFDGYEGSSRAETSLEGGSQTVWLTDEPIRTVNVVSRDGENSVEVTITQQG